MPCYARIRPLHSTIFHVETYRIRSYVRKDGDVHLVGRIVYARMRGLASGLACGCRLEVSAILECRDDGFGVAGYWIGILGSRCLEGEGPRVLMIFRSNGIFM